MAKLTRKDLDRFITAAKKLADIEKRGRLSPERVAENMAVRVSVRVKGHEKDWSDRKIQRRTRFVLASRGIFRIGKKVIPIRPFGGLLEGVGNTTLAVGNALRNKYTEEKGI
jgi:hypothetical protein